MRQKNMTHSKILPEITVTRIELFQNDFGKLPDTYCMVWAAWHHPPRLRRVKWTPDTDTFEKCRDTPPICIAMLL